jgi:hypothetical protein
VINRLRAKLAGKTDKDREQIYSMLTKGLIGRLRASFLYFVRPYVSKQTDKD